MSSLAHDRRASERPGLLTDAMINLRRRRSYLIDPKTQFTITRQFVVVLVAASALSVGNYHVLGTMLAVEKHDSFAMAMAYGYAATMLGVSFTMLFLLCVFFSHRIAGPARVLAGALNRMAQGDLCVKVSLRNTDLLSELGAAVNAANRDLRTSLGEVESEIKRARALANGGDNPSLENCLQRAEKALASFQIRSSTELHAHEVTARAVSAKKKRAQAS